MLFLNRCHNGSLVMTIKRKIKKRGCLIFFFYLRDIPLQKKYISCTHQPITIIIECIWFWEWLIYIDLFLLNIFKTSISNFSRWLFFPLHCYICFTTKLIDILCKQVCQSYFDDIKIDSQIFNMIGNIRCAKNQLRA